VPADRAGRSDIVAFCEWLKSEVATTRALSPTTPNDDLTS